MQRRSDSCCEYLLPMGVWWNNAESSYLSVSERNGYCS